MLFYKDHPSPSIDLIEEIVTPLPHPPSLYSLFYKQDVKNITQKAFLKIDRQ